MGYTLIIGEAEIEQYDEWVLISAKSATMDDAPNHCPFTKNGNMRSPSYTTWSEFCKEAGIFPMFYGSGWSREERRYESAEGNFYRETPILQDHPGASGLIAGDLEYVRAARINREKTNGGKPPGFWDDFEVDNGKDPVLARLVWLEYWIDWALKNCENPVLANS
jgi:hypothetical protein